MARKAWKCSRRPELHGLYRCFDRSVAGHDSDFDARVGAFDLLEKFDARHTRHDHVGKHHVDGLLFEQRHRGIATFGFEAGKAERLTDGDAEASDGLLVIDNQQAYAEVLAHKCLVTERPCPWSVQPP